MKNQKDPVYYQDATSRAEMIRFREISPVEIVNAHLDFQGRLSTSYQSRT